MKTTIRAARWTNFLPSKRAGTLTSGGGLIFQGGVGASATKRIW